MLRLKSASFRPWLLRLGRLLLVTLAFASWSALGCDDSASGSGDPDGAGGGPGANLDGGDGAGNAPSVPSGNGGDSDADDSDADDSDADDSDADDVDGPNGDDDVDGPNGDDDVDTPGSDDDVEADDDTPGPGPSPGPVGTSDDRPSTDDTWSDGLSTGANGPIPLIVVDQLGYRPEARKVAVIRDPDVGYDADVDFTPGTRYAVVDRESGETVFEGEPVPWNGGAVDESSGDRAWWFDFSDVTASGTYAVVDVDSGVRSVEFDIAADVYRSALAQAVRTFFYQRAGFAKSADAAGDAWADDASHLGPGQDAEAHAWVAKSDQSLVRDLRGGWYDAGDYNKYTPWAAGVVIALLRAYEENPSAFGDDLGIPESGNGVPDLLDEVKWSVDWLERMQNPDGSMLCILGLGHASPPSAATEPSYYGPETTHATLMGAAVFAYASKVYGARPEAELQEYAERLAGRAVQAWDWSQANPAVSYYNNDEGRQPGSGGLGAGQQETDDAGRAFSKFQAAVYLYETTGGEAYQTFAEQNHASIVPSWGPTQWDMEKQDAVLYYAQVVGADSPTGREIIERFVTAMQSNADQLPRLLADADPYRAPMTEYTWGSNQIKMAQARLYQLLAQHGSGDPAQAAAEGAEQYVHYLHGSNPLGLVYLTNLRRAGAEHSAATMYHTWFDEGTPWDEVTSTTPGPAPGFLVGGPNSFFELDGCCTAGPGEDAYQCYGAAEFALCSQSWAPPLNQPIQKSYLQFNAGWPAGSWAITEPSTGYQAKYVLVASRYAR